MTAEIANGITEGQNFNVCAACCKWIAWALPVAADVWNIHSMTLPW